MLKILDKDRLRAEVGPVVVSVSIITSLRYTVRDTLFILAYQEVFLKNGNSGAAAGKEEITIET